MSDGRLSSPRCTVHGRYTYHTHVLPSIRSVLTTTATTGGALPLSPAADPPAAPRSVAAPTPVAPERRRPALQGSARALLGHRQRRPRPIRVGPVNGRAVVQHHVQPMPPAMGFPLGHQLPRRDPPIQGGQGHVQFPAGLGLRQQSQSHLPSLALPSCHVAPRLTRQIDLFARSGVLYRCSFSASTNRVLQQVAAFSSFCI